jgi:hypothetical protein
MAVKDALLSAFNEQKLRQHQDQGGTPLTLAPAVTAVEQTCRDAQAYDFRQSNPFFRQHVGEISAERAAKHEERDKAETEAQKSKQEMVVMQQQLEKMKLQRENEANAVQEQARREKKDRARKEEEQARKEAMDNLRQCSRRAAGQAAKAGQGQLHQCGKWQNAFDEELQLDDMM